MKRGLLVDDFPTNLTVNTGDKDEVQKHLYKVTVPSITEQME